MFSWIHLYLISIHTSIYNIVLFSRLKSTWVVAGFQAFLYLEFSLSFLAGKTIYAPFLLHEIYLYLICIIFFIFFCSFCNAILNFMYKLRFLKGQKTLIPLGEFLVKESLLQTNNPHYKKPPLTEGPTSILIG